MFPRINPWNPRYWKGPEWFIVGFIALMLFLTFLDWRDSLARSLETIGRIPEVPHADRL